MARTGRRRTAAVDDGSVSEPQSPDIAQEQVPAPQADAEVPTETVVTEAPAAPEKPTPAKRAGTPELV